MTLFKFIRDNLSKIGFKASFTPSSSPIGVDMVKVDEHQAIKESIRKQFAEQERAMQIRSTKPHAPSCPDNWTCRKETCFVAEPDRIVVHRKRCVHANGIIPSEPACKCGISKARVKDKDFLNGFDMEINHNN
jgi:hypothetical protein